MPRSGKIKASYENKNHDSLTKKIYFTLSKSLVLCLLWAVDPENPSVSKHTKFKDGSNAAQTPTVQAFCSHDVRKTSVPLKKHWFRVYDFPSPVFPNIEITLTGLLLLYP